MTETNRRVKHVATGLALVLAMAAWAVPTKQQLAEAQQIVKDLTAADIRALYAKEKTFDTVAAAHLALADKAETEAGKYLLMQGAFRLYAHSGDYDSAAEVLQRMRGEIADLPPETIVEIVNKEMRRVAAEKAPKVLAIFRDAQRTIKCRKRLAAIEQAANSKPGDPALQRQLAECHACLGEWSNAIAIFAKIGDEAAKWELGMAKDCDVVKAADFWWCYKATDVEPFKAHAAALYKKGLEDGSITGLRKSLAEKRVKEMEGVMTVVSAVDSAPNAAVVKSDKPIIVKIKDDIELEFVPCPAGTFTMGGVRSINPITGQWSDCNPDNLEYKHKVTISRPFWMSKYPITVEQFGAFRSINDEFVKQNGKQGEPKMPVCLRVAAVEDYCKWLNRRFAFALPRKCIFRLPTDAEWEYSLCANSTDADDPYVRFRDNGKRGILKEICGTKFPVPVGTAGKPNAWGLYDMLGNGCHYVLDTVSSAAVTQDAGYGYVVPEKHKCGYKESEIDPLRLFVPKDNDKAEARHLMRGGTYAFWAVKKGPTMRIRMVECGEINRNADRPDRPRIWTFRVVIGPDLVAEKKAAAKK